jgi:hypothetical protein
MMRVDKTGNGRPYLDLERKQPYIILEVKR